MKRIEIDETCTSCGGKGLYIGMAERDGAAIVCHTCDGTGCHHYVHEYEDFTERKEETNAIRVYKTNPGIMIGAGNGFKLEDFGGIDYKEWKDGKSFPQGSEMRKYTCPRWWAQCAGSSNLPDWRECNTSLGCSFSKADCFKHKDSCWERYDKEVKE